MNTVKKPLKRTSLAGILLLLASLCAAVCVLQYFSIRHTFFQSYQNYIGNVLRYADVITEIPYTTSAAQADYYEAVPFLQMILHGSYLYSGAAAVNAETDKLTLLKAVEYGGAP